MVDDKNKELDYLILKLDYLNLRLSVLEKDLRETRTIRLLKNIIADEDILDIIEIVDAGIGFSEKSSEEIYTEELETVNYINEVYEEINKLDDKYYYFMSTLNKEEKNAFLKMTEIEKKEYRSSKTHLDINNNITEKDKPAWDDGVQKDSNDKIISGPFLMPEQRWNYVAKIAMENIKKDDQVIKKFDISFRFLTGLLDLLKALPDAFKA